MIFLSFRLLSLCGMVNRGSYIADVGSDHCALPIYLFERGLIRGAMAIENKKKPFERMKKAIEATPFPIIASLSDGLKELNKEVDTVILAGMGGNLIIDILEKGRNKLDNVETIVVDAHSDRPKVIAFLAKEGYHLAQNEFLYDAGVYYDIMKWEKGAPSALYGELELKYGPLNVLTKPKEWQNWLRHKIIEKRAIIEEIGIRNEKVITLEKEINEMEELLR